MNPKNLRAAVGSTPLLMRGACRSCSAVDDAVGDRRAYTAAAATRDAADAATHADGLCRFDASSAGRSHRAEIGRDRAATTGRTRGGLVVPARLRAARILFAYAAPPRR